MTDDPRTAQPTLAEWEALALENRRLRDALTHALSGCTVYQCAECDMARAALAATEERDD